MLARGEVENDLKRNGELALQAAVLKWWRATNRGDHRFLALDVGANVGEWTQALLAEAERQGVTNVAVIGFEPVPDTADLLRRRIAGMANGSRCEVVQAALSDANGTAVIHAVAGGGGTSSLHPASGVTGGEHLTIRTITADAFARERGLDAVHLMKIDAEGHDIHVLKGAGQMLEKGMVAVCQFEYNHRWVHSRSFLRDAFELAKGLPYSVGKILPEGVELFREWHPEMERFFEGNYALVRNDVAACVGARLGGFDPFNTFERHAAGDGK